MLSSDDRALRQPLAFPQAEYGERFVDIAFWRPFVEMVACAHDLPAGEIAMGEPGSFPTFILNRSHVVKLFGEHHAGLRSWAVESDVARLLEDAGVAIPVPSVVAAGALSRDPDWRYLVTAFVPGEPFATAGPHLDAAARHDVASDLGGMIRAVHDLIIPPGTALGTGGNDWASFIEGQRRDAAARHRDWGTLPERLLDEIDAYVGSYRMQDGIAPSPLHADLHDHHLIGEAVGSGWTIRGVIDWGDAWAGDRFYELPALHLGLFHGDRAMLRAFLEAYGWPGHRSDAFVRRAMAMTLLHEFNVLDKVGSMVDIEAIASLDDLAATLWRV